MIKKKGKQLFIELLILIGIVGIAAVTLPTFDKALRHFVMIKSEALLKEIKTSIGLDIQYEQLSPALITKLNLKNVVLNDANGSEIAHFESVLIEYNLFDFISGKTKNPIQQIIIRDGQMSYDENNGSIFFTKLFNGASDSSKKQKTDIQNFELPIDTFNVRLQNIFIRYNAKEFNAVLSIYSGRIFSKDKKIKYELYSTIHCLLKNSPAIHTARCDFTINGNTIHDFSFVSSVLNINKLQIDNAQMSKTAFFLLLQKKSLSVFAVQKDKGLDIQAVYNFETKKGKLSLGLDKVNASRAVNSSFQKFKFLNTTVFTGYLSADMDFSENAKEKIKYSCDVTVTNPLFRFEGFQTKNLSIRVTADGTDTRLNLPHLSVSSDILNFNSHGSYRFDTAAISFYASLNAHLPTASTVKTNIQLQGSKRAYFCTLSDLEIGTAQFSEAVLQVNPTGNNYDINVLLNDETGTYRVDANYTKDTSNHDFIEAHGVLNSVSVKNIFRMISALTQNKKTPFVENVLDPFRITTEFYLTSDLKSFSYNVIQLVFASTAADGMYALSSFNGSNDAFNMESFNLNIAQQQITGTAHANFGRNNDVFFDSLFSIAGISYNAAGIFSHNMINIYGDYGLSVNAYYEDKTLKGKFELQDFPIPILPFVFSISSNFTVASASDWQFVCENAKLLYTKNAIVDSYTESPFQLNFKGSADPKNVFISEIEMGNNKNILRGQASFDSISNDFDFFKQFSVIAKLKNFDNTQNFDLNCNFSLGDEMFMDGTCDIQNISLATFSNKQAEDDIINGRLTFLGTLENILLQANLQKIKMHLNNDPLEASCMFLIDDGTIRIPDASLSWKKQNISSLELNFLPKDGTGNLSFQYTGTLAQNESCADVSLDIAGKKVADSGEQMTAIEKIISVGESFVLNATVKDFKFGEKNLTKLFQFTVTRDDDTIAFYDKENNITGFYIDDGTVSLNMTDAFKTRLSFDGNITRETINLQCYNICLDIPQVMSFIPTGDYVHFDTGNLNGALLIEGKLNEPQFYGTLYLDDANLNSPGYAPDNLHAHNVPIFFDKYNLKMPKCAFSAKTFDFMVECTSEFDGWIPYNTVVICSIDQARPGHMKTENLLFHADGSVYCDLQMNITPDDMYLFGSAFFDKGSFSIAFDTFDEFNRIVSAGNGKFAFKMDLKLGLGQRAEYNWPNMKTPILRTLIPTEEPILMSSTPGTFMISGLAKMRGGEITYIRRNFYVKEGNIKFLETIDGFTPLLTLRAEVRDKDLEGKPVKLILKLKEQPLVDNYDTWITKITAEPAKSEQEVLQLFGQLVTGDMNKTTLIKDTLTNATDFASQITFAKNIENKIRDFLHLDVLSLRTQVFQNLVFGNIFKNKDQANLTIGDYLDNTSLYIGKYFGSAIYADAALHLSNYDPLKDRNLNMQRMVYKNILFEPEIGLEMATPFFNLRWAISPTNVNALFIDSASLTFSWNFSY